MRFGCLQFDSSAGPKINGDKKNSSGEKSQSGELKRKNGKRSYDDATERLLQVFEKRASHTPQTPHTQSSKDDWNKEDIERIKQESQIIQKESQSMQAESMRKEWQILLAQMKSPDNFDKDEMEILKERKKKLFKMIFVPTAKESTSTIEQFLSTSKLFMFLSYSIFSSSLCRSDC